ncbi:MAG: hypothetical protein HQL99_08950 [Magnetococcales bacterium]|nr:hypothetical protein [Magnetococcales bacterium]
MLTRWIPARIGFRSSGSSGSEILLALLLIGLAQWTLTTHVIGLGFGGHFGDLLRWAWWIPPGMVVLFRLIHGQPHTPLPVPVSTPSLAEQTAAAPIRLQPLLTAVTLVALFESAAVYFPSSRFHLFWIAAMLFLGQAWLNTVRHEGVATAATRQASSRSDTLIHGLLILGAVLITLTAHRPDPDDQYYSNLAVMTLEHPERPLLSWNGMIWAENLPTWLPVDRLPSIELLVAMIAHLLDVEPVAVSHLGMAPLFAAFTVLAHGALLRLLTPTFWLQALIVELFLLLALGGEIRASFGVFAFVQLHFGKSVLFSTLAPLVLLFALRYMRTGSRKDWLLLLVGQIAALGCSSSALFLAPATAGVGLAALWRPDRLSTRRLLTGLVSTVYPLGIGVALMASMSQTMQTLTWTPLSVEQNLARVLGSGPHLWLYLLTLIGAWTLTPDPRARRTLLGLSWVFMGIFLNPFLYPLFAQYLTGPLTTWRLLFALPLPAMAAILLLSLAAFLSKRDLPLPATPMLATGALGVLLLSFHAPWRGFWSQPFALACAILLLLFFAGFTSRWRSLLAGLILLGMLTSLTHLAPPNRRTPLAPPRTLMHAPTIKAPPQLFALAEKIVSLAPKDRSALLPEEVGVWVTTLRHHPRLVAPSRSYLEQSAAQLEPDALTTRGALLDHISGKTRLPDAPRQLHEAVRAYRIGLVAVKPDHPWLEEMTATMVGLNFQTLQHDGYRIWIPASSRSSAPE